MMAMSTTTRLHGRGRLTSAQGEHQVDVIHEAWQSRAVIRHRIAVPANFERAARQRVLLMWHLIYGSAPQQ